MDPEITIGQKIVYLVGLLISAGLGFLFGVFAYVAHTEKPDSELKDPTIDPFTDNTLT